MVNDLLELLGFALLVAFGLVVWWPLALLVAGAGLLLWANLRDLNHARRDERRTSA